MTSLLVRDLTAVKAKTDVLIVGLRPKGKSVVVVGLPTTLKSVASQLDSSLASVHAKADLQSVATIPGIAGLAATSIIAVGLGPVTASQTAGQQREALRLAAGAAVRSISKATTVAIISPSDDAESVAALAQGALLGAYRFTAFRSEQPTVTIKTITVITAAAKDRDVVAQTKSAVAIAQRVDLVKDLVNTPPSHLSPVVFAKTAAAEAKKRGITVQVLDEVQLKKRGFGGIIGVGQGSINPPRLVKLTYTHPQAKNTVAFVGKGVTFDSGGLSLKPPTAMETMKSDMAGAAAVLGAILSLADIQAKVNVTA
ncbi:MAG: M17 family peptidase N-terminal domain-containing protein, partial [Actinomycetes bacterium]